MTSTPTPMPGVQDSRPLLADAGVRRAAILAGHVPAGTIERYLLESCTALRRTSGVTAYLPVLAELGIDLADPAGRALDDIDARARALVDDVPPHRAPEGAPR